MANQLDLGLRALDANGYIAPGAKATVYLTGTSTLIDVWADADGSIAAANPIIADGNGYWPQRFVTQTAKVVITDADDVTLQTLDPAPTSVGIGSGASEVSFSPTVDIPVTDVQAAIELVNTNVLAGVADVGIGITGNADLLATIDATTIPAGVYRFDGTTTGTFPTGLAAADTGLVETWRQSSNAAMMEIGATTGHRVWRRRLVAGTWGAWRDVVSVGGTLADGDQIIRASGEWTRVAAGASQTRGFTWLAPQSTASGTEKDFTGIPAWATEIVVAMSGISLSGTDSLLVQLGDAGGFETSGYTGAAAVSEASVISTSSAAASGFSVILANAANAATGLMQIIRPFADNEWVSSANMSRGAQYAWSAQTKTLSDVLTQVRVTRSGSNTFDGGRVSVGYR